MDIKDKSSSKSQNKRKIILRRRILILMLCLVLIIGIILGIVGMIKKVYQVLVVAPVVVLLENDTLNIEHTEVKKEFDYGDGWTFTTENENLSLLYQLVNLTLNTDLNGIIPKDNGITQHLLLGIPCVETSGRLDFLGGNLLNMATTTESTPNSSGAVGPYQVINDYFWIYMKFIGQVSIDKYALDVTYVDENTYKNYRKPDRNFYPDIVPSVAYSFATIHLPNVDRLYAECIDTALKKYNITLNDEQMKELKQAIAISLYHTATAPETKQSLTDFLVLVLKEFGSFKKFSTIADERFHDTLRPYLQGIDENVDVIPNNYEVNGIKMSTSLVKYISDKYDANILRDYLNESVNHPRRELNFIYGIGVFACGEVRLQTAINSIKTSSGVVSAVNKDNFEAIDKYLKGVGVTYSMVQPFQTFNSYECGNDVKMRMKTVTINSKSYTFPEFIFDSKVSGVKTVINRNNKTYNSYRIHNSVKYDLGAHKHGHQFLINVPEVIKYASDARMDLRVLPALLSMREAWLDSDSYKQAGVDIKINSGYRSLEEERYVVLDKINSVNYEGRNNWREDEIDILINKIWIDKNVTEQDKLLRVLLANPIVSPHLTGRAFDILYLGLNVNSTNTNKIFYDWLLTYSTAFGFNFYTGECWHWEYNPQL